MLHSYHGDIYTRTNDQTAQKLEINLASANNTLAKVVVNISKKATAFSVSPNGKEVAFIARGEVFVTATKFNEDILLKNGNEAFQPKVSPDGKQIAYIKLRDEISVLDLASKKTHTAFNANVNYSYADGDINFDWSPDSQWITASYIPYGMYAFTNIGIAPADGSAPPKDISYSGYGDMAPRWINNEILLFSSARFGQRSHGSWGSDWDVMGLFLTQEAFDNYQLNKEERELIAETLKDKDTLDEPDVQAKKDKEK